MVNSVNEGFERTLRVVRAEFNDMPGLALTVRQAERLWGLDADTCSAVLAALIEAGFLTRTSAGGYARPSAA